MTQSLNIVALSPNDWHGQWVNRQQLLSRAGQRHPIIYSRGTWSIWDRNLREYWMSPLLGAFEATDNVLVDHPPLLLMRWDRVAKWDRLVLRAQAVRWRSRLRAPNPLVAYLCHPIFLPYVDALAPDFVVYHCYDLYENQPGWTPWLDKAERELLRRADLIFSPSRMLSDHLEAKQRCSARVLPNAADVELFFAAASQSPSLPPALSSIPEPRIGYIGSLHPQLDFDLVAELAVRQPSWHFVLVGPEQKVDMLHADTGYRACRARSNVHFIGEVGRKDVPSYLLQMQANVMFYRTSDDTWTHVAYPLKLHEYLACGRPVVSTPLPMIREFEEVIAFVCGAEAWEAALQSALDERGDVLQNRRRAIATEHTWDSRAQLLDGWLSELTNTHCRRGVGGANC